MGTLTKTFFAKEEAQINANVKEYIHMFPAKFFDTKVVSKRYNEVEKEWSVKIERKTETA